MKALRHRLASFSLVVFEEMLNLLNTLDVRKFQRWCNFVWIDPLLETATLRFTDAYIDTLSLPQWDFLFELVHLCYGSDTIYDAKLA